MVIQLGKYRRNFEAVKALASRSTDKKLSELTSIAAIATGCPVIVVLYFLTEIYGLTTELQEAIDRIKKFYRIEEVIE